MATPKDNWPPMGRTGMWVIYIKLRIYNVVNAVIHLKCNVRSYTVSSLHRMGYVLVSEWMPVVLESSTSVMCFYSNLYIACGVNCWSCNIYISLSTISKHQQMYRTNSHSVWKTGGLKMPLSYIDTVLLQRIYKHHVENLVFACEISKPVKR